MALSRCRRELEELESKRGKMMEHHREMKEPPVMGRPPCEEKNPRSLIAAVAIALVGSIIWIASD
jgi:hypothetical protein